MSDSDVSKMEEIMSQPLPEEGEECEICIFHTFENCVAQGETTIKGDCPSFKD